MLRKERSLPPGCFFVHNTEVRSLENVVCACHCRCTCIMNALASNWIIISLLYVSGFCLCRGDFACVEMCCLQVMGSTRISSLHMVSKATTGPLMNPHSTTMTEVTVVIMPCLKETYYAHFQDQKFFGVTARIGLHALVLKKNTLVFSYSPILWHCTYPLSETLCFSSCLFKAPRSREYPISSDWPTNTCLTQNR